MREISRELQNAVREIEADQISPNSLETRGTARVEKGAGAIVDAELPRQDTNTCSVINSIEYANPEKNCVSSRVNLAWGGSEKWK